MHVDKVRTGAPSGRSTAAQESRQAKWDRILDHAVNEKLSREEILRAFTVLSVLEVAYLKGNERELSKQLADANKLLVYVGKGLTERFGRKQAPPL